MRTPTLLSLTITLAAVLACGDSQGPGGGSGDGGGASAVLLQDVVVAHLPSPYYHFEYEPGGRIKRVSFASDFLSYDVLYVFARVRLTYDGDKLNKLDRERKLAAGFTIEKTLSFSYYADGNLEEIVDHRPAINGQEATTTVDRFEQYDDNVNVDAFGLIHNDFFDHVVLLPDVQLEKGNPARETFTGGGTDYRFDYTYAYDEHKRPLSKGGTATILTGPDAGRTVPLSTVFSYY